SALPILFPGGVARLGLIDVRASVALQEQGISERPFTVGIHLGKRRRSKLFWGAKIDHRNVEHVVALPELHRQWRTLFVRPAHFGGAALERDRTRLAFVGRTHDRFDRVLGMLAAYSQFKAFTVP